MVTEGVMVRFGRLVRGGRALDRCEADVAGVMVVPAANVAPGGSELRGGGSMELPRSPLELLPRCWPLRAAAAAAMAEAAAAVELELPVRLLVALKKLNKLINNFFLGSRWCRNPYLMLTAAPPLPRLLRLPLLCAGSGTADVGVTLSEPLEVRAAGIAASGLFGETLVGVTTRFSFITCCDCLSFLRSISLVSSFLRSCRNFRRLFSRSLSSAWLSSLMGTYGGISSSSVSESILPFCCLPLVLAGRRTMSGASAYDLGSVLGLRTLRCTLFSSPPPPPPPPLAPPLAPPPPPPPVAASLALLLLFVVLLDELVALLLVVLVVLLLLLLLVVPLFVAGPVAGVMVSPALLAVRALKSRLLSPAGEAEGGVGAGVMVNAGSRPELRLKSTTSSTSILAIFARRVVVILYFEQLRTRIVKKSNLLD